MAFSTLKLPFSKFMDDRFNDISRPWRDLLEAMLMNMSDIYTSGENRFTVVDATTSLTAGSSQIILVDATAGAVTVTLPAIADAPKYRYIIKKIDSSANWVTVDADGSETIDGALTMVISTQYDAPSFVPHGTEWSIV